MKKYIIYAVILVVGLLLGRFFFSGSSMEETKHNHDTILKTNQIWTCSMHPQIMQPETGDCPICGMDLIPAENGADGLLANQFKLTKNAMALANIETIIVGKANVDRRHTTSLSGKIAENEEANAVQVSYFSGRIEQLYVNFTGEEVRKGQLLATIYSPELFAAQQELITTSSLKASQPMLYRAVRNKLKLWKLSEQQINQIETSGKVKENFPVYATVSGTVTEKLVALGETIKQGQPLLKITNLNTVWANFDVFENQIDLFKKGQEINITTNAYFNKFFKAKVDFIDPILNTKTRTVTLRAVLSNINNIFKPGMFVTATIDGIKNNSKAIITIPATAVLWTGERSVVYLKTNPNQPVFEMREVVLGDQNGDEYEVLEGLFDGNEIVTNGTFTVDAAAQLQGKKSMMNNNGGKIITGHEVHSKFKNTATNINNNLNLNKRIKVTSDFQNQLKKVFNAYINIKDALVIENAKSIKAAAQKILENVPKIDGNLVSNKDAFNHWASLKNELLLAVSSIVKTTSLQEQRMYFKQVSSVMATALEVFGIQEKVYHQFCPMAENNQGAYWLSKDEKVINPYFGNAMLTCGEVKQVIE